MNFYAAFAAGTMIVLFTASGAGFIAAAGFFIDGRPRPTLRFFF